MSATLERVHSSLRFPIKDLAEIDERAAAHGLTRTDFLIAAALDRLPDAQSSTEQRLTELERRMQRLEDVAYTG